MRYTVILLMNYEVHMAKYDLWKIEKKNQGPDIFAGNKTQVVNKSYIILTTVN